MAKVQLLDLYLKDSKTVYQEVPYTVVIDWIQQGRLLETDGVRKNGEEKWRVLGKTKAFVPYFPKQEEPQVDDAVEALAPVQLPFQFNKQKPTEDDEVDMIPLIDVSLVLLIFFMMVTPAMSGMSFIPTPGADNALLSANPEEVTIGVNFKKEEGSKELEYFLVSGKQKKDQPTELKPHATLKALLAELDKVLAARARVEVTINAHENIPSGAVRKLILELEAPERRNKIEVFTGVSEK